MKQGLDLAALLGVGDLRRHQVRVAVGLRRANSHNPYLRQPIERLMSAQSKRLRSGLLMAVVASQDKPIDKRVIQTCVVIELLHLASLVHDDIMDQAQTRGGVATVSAQEGVAQAILVGDYLLARAGQLAAQHSAALAALVHAGFVELCDGQAWELGDNGNLSRTEQSLMKAIRGKTAALMATACQAGGLSAEVSAKHMKALDAYGRAFGVAFQLVDDVLDFTSTPELMGKSVGGDVREGVYTLPIIRSLKGKHALQLRGLIQANSPAITQLLIQDGSLQYAIKKAVRYNQQAAKALADLPGTNTLADLPKAYLAWALHNLVDPQYRSALT